MLETFVRRVAVALSLCVLVPNSAGAQSAITGLVTDLSRAVLPGVTVEAASPALIEKARTVVTDGQGRYAIVDLRPGIYTITFTLPGFSSAVRTGIDLPSNFAATVNVELTIGAVEESVTVSGQAPVVDVQSAQRTTVFARSQMDALPSNRTYTGQGALVVGMKVSEQNVGGARSGFQQRLTAHGSSQSDTTVTVDGVKLNTMSGGGTGVPDHNDAMTQEVTVRISAVGADVSGGGPHLNLVPREGGSTFSGANYAGYTGRSFQGKNLTPELMERGLQAPNATDLVYDVNPSVGGPILRDRLWFFGSVRKSEANTIIANSFYPDGSPGIFDSRVDNYTLRLTSQITERNKLTWYQDYQRKILDHEFSAGTDVLTASSRRTPGRRYTSSAKWTSTVNSRLLLEAAFARSANDVPTAFQPGIEKVRGTPEWYATASRQDIVLGTRTVSAGPLMDQYNHRDVVSSSVAYVTGSHAFKTGVQWQYGPFRTVRKSNADLVQRYRDGVPDSVTVYNTPSDAVNRMNADLGIYVMDTWTLKRLTLTPGLRYEYFNSSIEASSVPAGRFIPAREFPKVSDIPSWSNLAPRFGMVLDLTGDAKTALKASVNKYNRQYTVDFANRYNPLNQQTDTRNWFDCDYIPGTSTCSNLVLPTNRDNIAQDNEIGPANNLAFGQVAARRPAPDVKRPYEIEYSVGLERQLFEGVSVNASWYRRDTYNREKQDNLLVDVSDYASFETASPLNGELITIYNLNRAKQGLVDILDTTATDRTTNRATYNGFEFSAVARLPGGNSLMGGWSADHPINVTCDGDNPNTFRYCDQSQLDVPFRHDFKVAGSFLLPLGLQLGGTLQSYAGQPLSVDWAVPTNVFPGGRTQAVTVALIPPGAKYFERWNQFDLSVRKLFRVGRLRFDVGAEVFNALNSSVVLAENQSFGPTLGQPMEILPARLLRLSSQFSF